MLAERKPASVTRTEVDFIVQVLGIRPPARVLDVGCGFGRHAAELARRGYTVVGVDLSPSMIHEARRRFGTRPRLSFVRRDMRVLAYRGEFDAVFSMFNSFGYFDQRENQRTLRRMVRALLPGGRLLIDHRSATHDARYHVGTEWWQTRDGSYVLSTLRFDHARGIAHFDWRVVIPGGQRVQRHRAAIQVLKVGGWRRLFDSVGLRLVATYAGYDARRAGTDTGPRLIVVGQQRGR